MVDADESRVGDQVEALLAAIVRDGARQPISASRQAALRSRASSSVSSMPIAGTPSPSTDRARGRGAASASAGTPAPRAATSSGSSFFSSSDKQVVEQPLADAERRDDDRGRAASRGSPAPARSRRTAAAAGGLREIDLDRIEPVDVAARDHAAEVRSLVGLHRIVMHDVQRIAGLAHVEPGERPPRAADGVERPLLAGRQHFRIRQCLGDDLLGLLERLLRGLLEAQAAERERSRRPGTLPLMSTSSRLPPPRSPTTPFGSRKPDTTPSADRRASSLPDRRSTLTPVACSTAAMNSGPLAASRGAAVAIT